MVTFCDTLLESSYACRHFKCIQVKDHLDIRIYVSKVIANENIWHRKWVGVVNITI